MYDIILLSVLACVIILSLPVLFNQREIEKLTNKLNDHVDVVTTRQFVKDKDAARDALREPKSRTTVFEVSTERVMEKIREFQEKQAKNKDCKNCEGPTKCFIPDCANIDKPKENPEKEEKCSNCNIDCTRIEAKPQKAEKIETSAYDEMVGDARYIYTNRGLCSPELVRLAERILKADKERQESKS